MKKSFFKLMRRSFGYFILILSVCATTSCKKGCTINAYSLNDGSEVTKKNTKFTSTAANESAVRVTNGNLILKGCTINKTGDATNMDSCSFIGINAAVWADSQTATIKIDSSTVNTNATGANGIVANGGNIIATNVTVNCSGKLSHGIHVINGGTINAANMTINTKGDNSSVIATDRGGGNINVTGGTYQAKGKDAAIIYSTGAITTDSINGKSQQSEVAVVEGANSVSISYSTVTSGSEERGFLMLQSGSGDAQGINGNMSVTNSNVTLTTNSAPLIEVCTNTTGNIQLNNDSVIIPSNILMRVDFNTRWQTNGATGNLTLSGPKTYNGSIEADTLSNANITVENGTTWVGAFDTANTALLGNVTIKGIWNLTANSNIDTLTVSKDAVINKNGFIITTKSTKCEGKINN